MTQRDVATVAFRSLALWITSSALTALVDLLFNWNTVAAQVMGSFSDVTNPPTRGELFWMSATLDRRDLYGAASFLVGLWLIAVSLPGLAFEGYAATRPGVPAYPEAHAQVPLLVAQLVLGIALIRGRWLVGWATSDARATSGAKAAEGAVQQ